MTDRLDDLKRLAPDPGINTPVNWAIDEIERLRVEFHTSHVMLNSSYAEIERLRALVGELREALAEIADSGCCETPSCSIDTPFCTAMIARAALEKAKEV